MKIALVQQHATPDKSENIARAVLALEEAAARGARLVAYAELAFDRFLPQRPADPEILEHAEPVPGPLTDLFCRKAKELGVVVVLNLFERDGDETFDTSPLISEKGEILGKVRMMHIVECPGFHEQGYYAPGDLGAGVFSTSLGRIGIAICYDRHFPEYMRLLALQGAELVVIPQAGAVDEWPEGLFEAELRVASFQNGYYAALVNRVGEEELLTFAGESFITDPNGKVAARAPQGEDYILYHDLDLNLLKECAARKHFLQDRRPELYEKLSEC